MKITYKREVRHCETSPYVRLVTIDTITPAENSDFLEKITFKEVGWNVISRKGLHEPGKSVMLIPPESVLPFELSEELEVTNYLSKGMVRAARFRGNRSEGLIVDEKKVEPYLPYIMKWDELPCKQIRGKRIPGYDIPIDFEIFYHIPNILNKPDTFYPGELISVSEKVHGMNTRCGNLPHPQTGKYGLYVGSHKVVLKESKKNTFWRVVRKRLADRLPPAYMFYGETFGLGIKHLHYERNIPDILLFASMVGGKYLNCYEFRAVCERYHLPCVQSNIVKFESLEQLRVLADEPSTLTKAHHREGIVIVSVEDPRKMAKCISFKYQTSKDKGK